MQVLKKESDIRFTFYFALFCHCCLNNFPSLFSFVVCFVFVPQDEQMHVNVLWKWKDKEQPKLQACHLLHHVLLRYVSVITVPGVPYVFIGLVPPNRTSRVGIYIP